MSLPPNFWAKVDKTDTCWLWTAGTNGNGYGRTDHEGRKQYVHRLAYVDVNGLIPDGLTIDHLCMNTRCVNPEHLQAVTRGENMRRGYAIPTRVAVRRHEPCRNGHARTPENVYISKAGKVHCRPCNRANQARYAAAKRAAA